MTAPTFTLPNRKLTWLITGCSSGFGLSLARIVQAGGHKLVASSRDPSKTPDLVAEVESRGGKWVQLDVDSQDTPRVIDELEKAGDAVDVLVNNAGYSVFAPVETSSEGDVRAQMETVFFGPLRLIRAVLPHFRQRRFGVVVNMSSGASLEGNPTMGAYAGAKGGLDALTRVLAKEVAPFNIRTITAVLGTFNTNFGSSAVFSKDPLPTDYEGSLTHKMIQYIESGQVPVNGDKDKAMRALYEVVVGEGAGVGRGSENFLPLGTDMVTRVKTVQNYLQHSLDVFETVAVSVAIEK
ncbi:hypothetical protein F4778DRAFT_770796 [Xylariomycetidae sp. FL2044]|nr:hypothetical protein F4778DRAFT_770796 [Xylariomycetidae sp. FL2044]